MRKSLSLPLKLFVLFGFLYLFLATTRPVCAATSEKRVKLIERFCDNKKMRVFLKRQKMNPSITPHQIFVQKESRQKGIIASDNQLFDKNVSNLNLDFDKKTIINEENCQEMITQLSPKEFIKNLRDNREKHPGLLKKILLFIGIDKTSK